MREIAQNQLISMRILLLNYEQSGVAPSKIKALKLQIRALEHRLGLIKSTRVDSVIETKPVRRAPYRNTRSNNYRPINTP